MAVLRCKMCGASLNVTEGASITECEFCGSRQTIPRIRLQNQGEKKATLFGRAGRLLGACEFDKAYTVYEGITEEFPEEAEAYWGLLLCRYGIEYVDDPETGRKIPTCHRSSFTSLNEDEDFRMVLKYAAPEALPLYQEEGRQIEELRRQILQASAREQPYDIFLCYKESDEGGNRTQDSVTAQEIYDHLTQHGYRVFFSRISLEEKLGAEYEPVIFAALQSAKIMLAVGSSYEHFNAVWVKNEWSRFLKLIQSGQKKVLIPCYFDMDPEDLPAELSHLQAQDMKKLGALQDLTRGIDKLLGRKAQNTSQAPGSDSTVQAYLKRVDLFLEDGEWDHAEEYCEKILDLDPDNSSAYLRRWLAEHRSASLSELVRAGGIFEDDGDYQKAVRFAEAGRKKQLKEAAEAAKEALYQKYVRLIRQTKAPDISQLEEAKKQLPRLRDYKDAKKLLSECNEIHNTILLGITDQIMKEAADAMKAGKYETALQKLRQIQSDESTRLQAECKQQLAKQKKEEQKRREREAARQEAASSALQGADGILGLIGKICGVILLILGAYLLIYTIRARPGLYTSTEAIVNCVGGVLMIIGGIFGITSFWGGQLFSGLFCLVFGIAQLFLSNSGLPVAIFLFVMAAVYLIRAMILKHTA